MDVSARTTMKDAAKCDKRCEWQNFANQENAERILRFQVIPESMSVSGRSYCYAFNSRSYFGDCELSAPLCVSDEKSVVTLNTVANCYGHCRLVRLRILSGGGQVKLAAIV